MEQSKQPVYKFTAFISYKRGEDDEKYARWLQGKLESFRIPTEIAPQAAGDTANRRFRVFRDKTDLGSHAELREGLHKSLEQCRYLIVVCSPRSAASPERLKARSNAASASSIRSARRYVSPMSA